MCYIRNFTDTVYHTNHVLWRHYAPKNGRDISAVHHITKLKRTPSRKAQFRRADLFAEALTKVDDNFPSTLLGMVSLSNRKFFLGGKYHVSKDHLD
jgi:hypothetical protein